MTTLPPPPAPRQKPNGTTTPAFPPPTGAQILRALRAPAIGYAWLLAGAVLMMVLIVVAANVGSTGDQTGVGSDDTNAFGVLIGMPFQLAGMALLGSLRYRQEGVTVSLFFPPLLLTALYLAMTAHAARGSEVIAAAGTRALLGVVVGFAAAAVVTPLTWALAMRDDGAALHAASIGLFFGAWVLTGVASYVGTSRTAGAMRPAWVPRDCVAAARVWVGSVVVWIVLAVAVLTIVAIVDEGLWVGILFPIWAVTVGLYSYAIGHLGGVYFAGETLKVGDFDAVWSILLVVGALALGLLASVAWHLRRDTSPQQLSQPGSWVTLPATYAVGGMLVWLVPSVVIGGAYSGIGGSVTVQPGFWLVFVLAAWGAAVEAGSRFVAPSLATALPPRVHAALRGPDRVEPSLPDGSAAAPGAARPLTAAERARYKRIAVIGGGLAALGILAWITTSVVNSQLYSPADQAATYLDAIVANDLGEVNNLAPTDDHADDALLTSKIYGSATMRITGYDIGDVDTKGDTATVEIRLKGLAKGDHAELTLKKDGHSHAFFDKWTIEDGGLAESVTVFLPDRAGDLAVNGVAVDVSGDDVWLLPGDYAIDAYSGNKWVDGSGDPVTVAAGDDSQYLEVPDAVASDAFRQEVQSQVDAFITECMASTELEPDGCPNSAYTGTDVRNVVWSLDTSPTPDFDYFDGTFPADLSFGESGRATVTYEADESYGYGRPDWQPKTEQSDLYLGTVTVTENGDGLDVAFDD